MARQLDFFKTFKPEYLKCTTKLNLRSSLIIISLVIIKLLDFCLGMVGRKRTKEKTIQAPEWIV
jgi:hypothetical protein